MSKYIYFVGIALIVGFAFKLKGSPAPITEIEEVIVHTDRPLYVVGETVWFSAYCFSNLSLISHITTIASVELLDNEGNTVVQTRIHIKNGVGNGHVALSSDIPSGSYVLNVYPLDIINKKQKNISVGTQLLILNPKNLSTSTYDRSQSESPKRSTSENKMANNIAIKIKPNKQHYEKREKIKLTLDTMDAVISISVYKADYSLPTVSNLIRFPSSPIQNSASIELPAEKYAPIISGKINRLDLPNACLMMSMPGKRSYLNSLTVKAGDAFHFEIPPNSPSNKVCFAIIVDNLVLHPLQLEIHRPFAYWSPLRSYRYDLSDVSIHYLNSLMINMQISRVYKDHLPTQGQSPSQIFQVEDQFYGTPDHVYHLKDYVKFDSFQELFKAIVKEIKLKKQHGEWLFYLKNHDQPSRCAVFINGLPVESAAEILTLNPDQVERLEIVSDSYQLNANRYEHGMINIITKNGEYSPNNTEHIICTQIASVQRSNTFYAPSYDHSKHQLNRIPDYRNTLYWNPSYHLDTNSSKKDITFFTSDDVGDYRVEIIGFDNNGQKIYGTTTFSVN